MSLKMSYHTPEIMMKLRTGWIKN